MESQVQSPDASDQSVVIGQCYFFGCHRQAGHYLWTEKGSMADRIARDVLPFRYTILDAGLLPELSNQTEGEATIVHWPKWTVVSFWDRSVDKRGGCNSSFVIPAVLSFDEAIAVAKKRFPWVWSRFTFEVCLSR
jgi:hypothetical protein